MIIDSDSETTRGNATCLSMCVVVCGDPRVVKSGSRPGSDLGQTRYPGSMSPWKLGVVYTKSQARSHPTPQNLTPSTTAY